MSGRPSSRYGESRPATRLRPDGVPRSKKGPSRGSLAVAFRSSFTPFPGAYVYQVQSQTKKHSISDASSLGIVCDGHRLQRAFHAPFRRNSIVLSRPHVAFYLRIRHLDFAKEKRVAGEHHYILILPRSVRKILCIINHPISG